MSIEVFPQACCCTLTSCTWGQDTICCLPSALLPWIVTDWFSMSRSVRINLDLTASEDWLIVARQVHVGMKMFDTSTAGLYSARLASSLRADSHAIGYPSSASLSTLRMTISTEASFKSLPHLRCIGCNISPAPIARPVLLRVTARHCCNHVSQCKINAVKPIKDGIVDRSSIMMIVVRGIHEEALFLSTKGNCNSHSFMRYFHLNANPFLAVGLHQIKDF